MKRLLFFLYFVVQPVSASCILRNVINHTTQADVILRNLRVVKGTKAVKGSRSGALVSRKPSSAAEPVIVEFNQPTGNEMHILVIEGSELGENCKEYLFRINEQDAKIGFLKRESCSPRFGYDNITKPEPLPDRCYIDLELREDVNGLQLKVLGKNEVVVIVQELEEQQRKAREAKRALRKAQGEARKKAELFDDMSGT
jgi:hypothetical protein